MTKIIFFDVANTLLNKPTLFPTMMEVFKEYKIEMHPLELESKHKLLSEVILFPDKTSKEFYQEFNRELLRLLGIVPTDNLIQSIFNACTYLPWKPFDDTKFIKDLSLPKAILSNWDNSLESKLGEYFNFRFDLILGSENIGIRKPDPRFFQLMIEKSGYQPNEILFVGDSLKLDIEPAIQLGLNAVLIDRANLYPYANVRRIQRLDQILTHIQ